MFVVLEAHVFSNSAVSQALSRFVDHHFGGSHVARPKVILGKITFAMCHNIRSILISNIYIYIYTYIYIYIESILYT